MSLKVCDPLIAAKILARLSVYTNIYKVEVVFGIKDPLSADICKEYKFCSPNSRAKIST